MRLRYCLALVMAVSAFCSYAQDRWFNGFGAIQVIGTHMRNNRVAGIAVAVARNGRLAYSEGFGWKNREANVPSSDYTRFRLAQLSECVTSLLALELVRRNQIELDAQVRRYLRSIPAGHTYTVRHLLAHTSGIRSDTVIPARPRPFANMSDACKAFISDDLLFKPGQKFEESANAYSVLGWLIESVTKKPFLQYAHERFRAWGLPDLDVENVAQSGFSRSEIYVVTNGRFRTAKRDDLSVLYPGAGLESSARDLALLGAKVLEGKIIERSFLDSVAWKPQSAGGKATGFALGWDVGMISGRRVVGRSGSLNGGSSQWWLYPDHNTIVVVLSNTRHEGTAPLARSIGDIALNDAANVPGRPFN